MKYTDSVSGEEFLGAMEVAENRDKSSIKMKKMHTKKNTDWMRNSIEQNKNQDVKLEDFTKDQRKAIKREWSKKNAQREKKTVTNRYGS